MKRFFKSCVACAAMALSMGSYAHGLQDGTELIFTTGSLQGTYYSFGKVIASTVSENTSTYVSTLTSKGSKENIEIMEQGQASLAFVQADVAAYAYNGKRLFKEPYKDFSTVANLYMEQVQIVTVDPKIKTIKDLKGKTVSVGSAGSGVFFNALDILKVYGLDIEKDIKPNYLSFGDSVDALKNGKIDAAFIVAGAPTTAVLTLAETKKMHLVSLDKEHIDKLLKNSSYYCSYTIDKSIYNSDKHINTVAVGGVLFARNDVRATDIYNVLTGIFGHIDEIREAHDKAQELDMKIAVSYEAVPYHKGALQFYKERGYEPKVKKP